MPSQVHVLYDVFGVLPGTEHAIRDAQQSRPQVLERVQRVGDHRTIGGRERERLAGPQTRESTSSAKLSSEYYRDRSWQRTRPHERSSLARRLAWPVTGREPATSSL